MSDRRTFLQSALGVLGMPRSAPERPHVDAPATARPGTGPAVTFDAPVCVDGWLYTVRYWSPAAWDELPPADRPGPAARMNDGGWRWQWLLEGPSPELVRSWEKRERFIEDCAPGVPGTRFRGAWHCRETGACYYASGELVLEGSEYLSSRPPTDWSRITGDCLPG